MDFVLDVFGIVPFIIIQVDGGKNLMKSLGFKFRSWNEESVISHEHLTREKYAELLLPLYV